jgi:hypothetical protein
MKDHDKFGLELRPTLDYAAPPDPRSRPGLREIAEDVIDAVGPRFLVFAAAVTLFFGGLAIGGGIGIPMTLPVVGFPAAAARNVATPLTMVITWACSKAKMSGESSAR